MARKDFYKIIVERPRRGHSMSYNGTRKSRRLAEYLEDNCTNKIGIKKPHTIAHGWGCKELNENLGPLKRFIRSKVGQPWDAIYSEICLQLKGDSTVKQHVKDHLHQYVEVDHRYQRGFDRGNRFRLTEYKPEFYVDINGILCHNQRIPRKKNSWYIRQQKEINEQYKKDDTGVEIWKVEGIWYTVIWSQIPPDKISNRIDAEGNPYAWVQKYDARDIMNHQIVRGAGKWYRSGKKQANSKILKKFVVQND